MLRLFQQPYCLEARGRAAQSRTRNDLERFWKAPPARKGLANGGLRGTVFGWNQPLVAGPDESTNFISMGN